MLLAWQAALAVQAEAECGLGGMEEEEEEDRLAQTTEVREIAGLV